ncbi:hypothetical protein JXJ21_20370 [candidate division KSB1 bacterium]|nr:hypothetical protein [candidate division KSB1 bacterium]
MNPFPFGIPLTLLVLAGCLFLAAFLIRRIVNKIKKSTGSRLAIYLYLLVSLWTVYEMIKIALYDVPWFANPFFYFWLLMLLYCVVSFLIEHSKQQEQADDEKPEQL